MNGNDRFLYVLLIELESEAIELPGWQLVCTEDTSSKQSLQSSYVIIRYHKSIPKDISLYRWWKPMCFRFANLPYGVSGESFGYLAHRRGPGGDSPFMQCVKSWLISLGYAAMRTLHDPFHIFLSCVVPLVGRMTHHDMIIMQIDIWHTYFSLHIFTEFAACRGWEGCQAVIPCIL